VHDATHAHAPDRLQESRHSRPWRLAPLARPGWEGLPHRQAGRRRSGAIDSILEAQVEVGDFDAAQSLLEAMGFIALRYQENYREEWQLGDVVFDFDTWLGLPTFLEIEGPDEPAVQHAADSLGFDFAAATFGSVDQVYLSMLGRDILAEPRLVFD